MTRMIFKCFALSALMSTQLMAGVVYEIDVTDHEQTPPAMSETEMAVEGKLMKMLIAPSDHNAAGGDMIWRGDRREMIVVDHDEKSYMVMDEEMIRSIAGQLSGVQAQIAEALKNVPADQRAMVEKMMKQRMPQQAPQQPVIEVIATSDAAEKNGYPCVKYLVLSDGRELRRLWVTDWENVEGGEEASEVFNEMSDFFSEMMEAFSQAAGGMFGGDFGGADAAFAQWSEVDGFPVLTEELADDGSLENEAKLRSARRETLDPAEFEPPSGYKRRSMGPQ